MKFRYLILNVFKTKIIIGSTIKFTFAFSNGENHSEMRKNIHHYKSNIRKICSQKLLVSKSLERRNLKEEL